MSEIGICTYNGHLFSLFDEEKKSRRYTSYLKFGKLPKFQTESKRCNQIDRVILVVTMFIYINTNTNTQNHSRVQDMTANAVCNIYALVCIDCIAKTLKTCSQYTYLHTNTYILSILNLV